MYQPYPSAGQAPEPVRPGPPPSVVMAVRLMYAGAAVSALSLIVGLVTGSSLRSALHKSDPSLPSAHLHNLQTVVIVGSPVIGPTSIALCVWMARVTEAQTPDPAPARRRGAPPSPSVPRSSASRPGSASFSSGIADWSGVSASNVNPAARISDSPPRQSDMRA